MHHTDSNPMASKESISIDPLIIKGPEIKMPVIRGPVIKAPKIGIN